MLDDATLAAAEHARTTLPAAQVTAIDALDEDRSTRDRILAELAFLAAPESAGLRAYLTAGLRDADGLTLDPDGVWRDATTRTR